MNLVGVAKRCLQQKYNQSMIMRTLFTNLNSGLEIHENQPIESEDAFESRIYCGFSDENSSSFFQRLHSIEKVQNEQGKDSKIDKHGRFERRLKEAARYFEFDSEEVTQDDYTFRSDMNFKSGMAYTTELQDLNFKKPGVWKPSKRSEFQVTSEEVLRKSDFRNVRFLANFLTDAGIIIKRSKTEISAKAQRKVAREIKIARAFGLLPFTTMGTKQFVFGRTMEDLEEDYQLDVYEPQADTDNFQDLVAE